MACRILVPQLGIEPAHSKVTAWSPNHWTTRNSSIFLYEPVSTVYLVLESPVSVLGLPGGSVGKKSTCNAGGMQFRSLGWEDPLQEGMAIHCSVLAGECQGQRSLLGSSSWGCKELDMTEVTEHKPAFSQANVKEQGRCTESLTPGLTASSTSLPPGWQGRHTGLWESGQLWNQKIHTQEVHVLCHQGTAAQPQHLKRHWTL